MINEIIQPISYCFGVKRAIDLVNKIIEENKGKQIYLFGELIHNKLAMKPLLDKGVKVVEFDKNNAKSLLNSFSNTDIVIFSAHGHSKEYEQILDEKGVKYYDATCPIVNLNLKKIKEAKTPIIFIGKENHPETLASLSYSKHIYLYDVNKGIDYSKITSDKNLILNQTTLSFLELENIFDDIKKHYPNSIFTDEICNASRVRQEKISNLNDTYDLVIVLGDRKSSNTTKLYEISIKNKKRDTFFISSLDELKKIDLSKYKKAAIFSGTSCPMNLINDISNYLTNL